MENDEDVKIIFVAEMIIKVYIDSNIEVVAIWNAFLIQFRVQLLILRLPVFLKLRLS